MNQPEPADLTLYLAGPITRVTVDPPNPSPRPPAWRRPTADECSTHTKGERERSPASPTVTFRLPAGPHTRFAAEAAASMIGQTPRFNGRASVVVAAKVVDDGTALEVTIQVAGAFAGAPRRGMAPAEPLSRGRSTLPAEHTR